ncbi:MAG TPA: M28 family peptidase [Panacibacter sp.]|nr:M28 family peptidase [Panacibacter sp.]
MNKFLSIALVSFFTTPLGAQNINALINAKEVERIETVLASDDMQGRKTFTAGIEKAADFVSNEFKKAGLKTFNKAVDYRQSFFMLKPSLIKVSCILDGQPVAENQVNVITATKDVSFKNGEDFEQIIIGSNENFFSKAQDLLQSGKNYIVFVDTSFTKNFNRLAFFKRQLQPMTGSVVFVLTNQVPKEYTVEAKHSFDTLKLSNIVGVLPGKSKPDEYVIFSGHYDHLGIGKPIKGDSLYNGANDDAAGTTAVIMLAKYFKALHNNERTIIFTTFTAEEIGGFGSQYFSKQLDPLKVMAMFNIEMIGTESKWGANSAYITGYEKSDMGAILQKNLEGSSFTFYPDPYTEEQLFYRSDNATLARKGVPAHTISTSKMDNEPNYHKPSDEIGTLNLNNMAEIIKAIAISAKGIVSGKETPSRVDTTLLK